MEENQGVRLNKYLSEAGVCSRREADRLIEAGEVKVDGRTAVTGMRVQAGQQVVCGGKRVEPDGGKPVLLAVNKPVGVVCTTSDKDRALNIVEMVGYPSRVYPIGRLDKDSEGLILMTNQGDLVNKIMRSGNSHEKEYQVAVDKPVTEEFLKQMRAGVPILDTVTKPCFAKQTGERSFRVILTQGLNRQIRRMCEYLGYQVTELKRIRIMNICLGELETGACRQVTPEEYRVLEEALKESSSLSYKDSMEKYGRYMRANHQIPRQKESQIKCCKESRDGQKDS